MRHISDETLSAFFDNELAAHDMEIVREAMVEDPELTDRLAQLALVNEKVKEHAACIDKYPVPEPTLNLLTGGGSDRLHWWQNIGQRRFASPVHHVALAASTLLILGSVAGYWLNTGTHTQNPWLQVEQQLYSTPSGRTVELADGQRFTSQFSFHAKTGELCRVYQLEYSQRAESIACWSAGSGWQNILTTYSTAVGDGEYVLASGSEALLQQQVGVLQATGPLTLEQERTILEQLKTK